MSVVSFSPKSLSNVSPQQLLPIATTKSSPRPNS